MKKVYVSFTLSKDETEHCSLSYRRVEFTLREAEELVKYISTINPQQVKSLSDSFNAIFKENEEESTKESKPSFIGNESSPDVFSILD